MANVKSQIDNSNRKSADVKVRAYKFSLTIITFVINFQITELFGRLEINYCVQLHLLAQT